MNDPFSGSTDLCAELRFVGVLLLALAAAASLAGCATIGLAYCDGDQCAGVTVTPQPR